MRQIKFRAWDTYTKQMFITGFHLFGEAMEFGMVQSWVTENPKPDTPYLLRMNDIEVMQYSGLKDKNGKECYASDIIQDHNGRIYVCRMSDQYLEIYFEVPEGGQSLTPYGLLLKSNGFEIIGNIYENPELLTVESNQTIK